MLVLSRKLKQEILIGDNVKITVLKVKGNTVRLGIEAPRDIHVMRGELEKREGDATPTMTGKANTNNENPEENAEFTIVFSNSDSEKSAKIDVLPFKTKSQTTNDASPQSPPSSGKLVTDESESIQFRGRLPKTFQHNRLKEIVSQLTTKS